MAKETLEFKQPSSAEILVLPGSDDGALEAISGLVDGADVPDYMVAAALLQRHHASGDHDSGGILDEELAEIAVGWAKAQKILDAESGSPVLYIGSHMQEVAAGFTTAGASLNFEGQDHNGGAANLTIPTEVRFTSDDWDGVTEGGSLSVYRPVSVLTSGSPSNAKKFIDYYSRPHILPGPGQLVVGQKAISAYSNACLAQEVSREADGAIYDAFGFWDSEALLSLAALKKVGVSPNLTARSQKIIHRAANTMVARVLADSLGVKMVQGNLAANSARMNRLTGIDFGTDDLDAINKQLAGFVKGADETPPIIEFLEQSGGNVQNYLRDVSAAFTRQLLANQNRQ